MEKTLVARWESRGGAYWAELYRDQYGYRYKGSRDCGGNFGKISESDAVELMESYVRDGGYFQPDKNITPMRRVSL